MGIGFVFYLKFSTLKSPSYYLYYLLVLLIIYLFKNVPCDLVHGNMKLQLTNTKKLMFGPYKWVCPKISKTFHRL